MRDTVTLGMFTCTNFPNLRNKSILKVVYLNPEMLHCDSHIGLHVQYSEQNIHTYTTSRTGESYRENAEITVVFALMTSLKRKLTYIRRTHLVNIRSAQTNS